MEIEYHPDARGLAINVKAHGLSFETEIGTESQREAAWWIMIDAWWQQANEIAWRHGYEYVESGGRSGGWLVAIPVPQGDEGEEYKPEFVDEIEALHRAAPDLYKDILIALVKVQ